MDVSRPFGSYTVIEEVLHMHAWLAHVHVHDGM
jgi:hypothetical protein